MKLLSKWTVRFTMVEDGIWPNAITETLAFGQSRDRVSSEHGLGTSMHLRPIKPIRPGLSPMYLRDRIQWSDAANASVVYKQEYSIDAARTVDGFAGYLECWERHSRDGRLPTLSDFDGIRSLVGIAGVHLVDVSAGNQAAYRFLSFDATTRYDRLDLSGTYVREYPHPGVRRLGLIDYSSAVARGEGVLSSIDVEEKAGSRRFARLVLPISDTGSGTATKLMVIVRLNSLRHQDASAMLSAGSVDEGKHGRKSARGRRRMHDASSTGESGPVSLASHEAILRRFFAGGRAEFLEDGELLEMLLSQAVPPESARTLAARLLEEFATLPAVLAMGQERSGEFPGLSSKAIVALKVARELATRIVRIEVADKPQLTQASMVIDYCRARMAHESIEHVRVLFLDQKNRLIADEAIHGGGVSAVPLNPQHIVKRAIVLDAQSIILAHNHPSGDPTPSNADIEATRLLRMAVSSVGLRLLDHFIIGRSGHVSLGSLGHLDDEK